MYRFHDFLVNFVGAVFFFGVGDAAAHEFVEADADAPEVDVEGVAFAGDDLGGHVVGGSDDGECPVAFCFEEFGGSHVDKFDGSL